jgi:antitoxin (DNA-binding transcriptional repressor) of toxin-antitoxin stability system
MVMKGVVVSTTMVSIADAKAHLSELVDLAAAGESVVITKRGKPVLQMQRPSPERKPIDLAAMQSLTAKMPAQPEGAGEFMRQLRDESRY